MTLLSSAYVMICFVRTYKLPSRNTTLNCNLKDKLGTNFHTWRIGRAKMSTSVVTFGIALPMNESLRLMHVPAMVGFQSFVIGVHSTTISGLENNFLGKHVLGRMLPHDTLISETPGMYQVACSCTEDSGIDKEY
jgi:hypothetical protein